MLEETMVSFTAHDRCDRCGAQAYAQAEKWGAPAHLLFCLHHSKEFKDALLNYGWTIRWDEENIETLIGVPGASV